ncbi:hypothetical protein ES703_75556 [subsurface metagenome]
MAALIVRSANTVLRNKTVKVTTIQWAQAGAADHVPHISAGPVKLMAVVVTQNSRPKKVAY